MFWTATYFQTYFCRNEKGKRKRKKKEMKKGKRQ